MIRNILFGILLMPLLPVKAQTITLKIANIRSPEGQLCIALFENQQQFRSEKPGFSMVIPKTQVRNGCLTVKIPCEPGIYGISVLDDANADGGMNYYLGLVPSEGFGFSDYRHKGLTHPVFDDFSFKIEPQQDKLIQIQLQYLRP